MSDKITEFLSESQRIEEEATPGPWTVGWGGDGAWVTFLDAEGERGRGPVISSRPEVASLEVERLDADADFIAHARAALPKMRRALEAVLEMRAKLPDYDYPDNLPTEFDAGYVDGVLAARRAIESALAEEES